MDQQCGFCGGIGQVQDMEVRQHGRYAMQWARCPDCSGTGTITPSDPEPPIAAAPVPVVAETFIVAGKAVTAPGFTPDQLIAFVARAKRAQLRTVPCRTPGAVKVSSSRSAAMYVTTRRTCSCSAGQHGRVCFHRAFACWLVDIAGIDIIYEETIGCDQAGTPLTIAARRRQLAVAS